MIDGKSYLYNIYQAHNGDGFLKSTLDTLHFVFRYQA